MTDPVDLLRRLHQHRAWATSNVLDAAATLSDDALHQTFAIGQGSIWKSLLHMYAAEWVWLAALEGVEDACLPGDERGKLPGNQLAGGDIVSLTHLRSRRAELEARWQSYLAALTPAALDETVYRISAVNPVGKRFGTRRSDVLLHVATHAHYTVAQTVNMLRQCGVEPLPATMLISLARQESPPAA